MVRDLVHTGSDMNDKPTDNLQIIPTATSCIPAFITMNNSGLALIANNTASQTEFGQ